jgi:hypothetical protein
MEIPYTHGWRQGHEQGSLVWRTFRSTVYNGSNGGSHRVSKTKVRSQVGAICSDTGLSRCLAMQKYSPPWHFSYFVALQPGIKIKNVLVVCIIWFKQHAYHFEDATFFFIVKQTRNMTSQYFVVTPFTAITALGVCLYKLGTSSLWDFWPFFKVKLLQVLQVGWVPLVYSSLYVIPQILNWIEVWALTISIHLNVSP